MNEGRFLLQRRLSDMDGARWRTLARITRPEHLKLAQRISELVKHIDPNIEWRIVPDAPQEVAHAYQDH